MDDLDLTKLKDVPVDLKNLSDVVDNKVVKNTKLNTIETKLNNLDKKIPDATTFIGINQYNTAKQNLEDKTGEEMLIKKYEIKMVKWLQLTWIQKLVTFRIKH